MQIRDRIKSLIRVRAGDLLPSPKNWRVHTDDQKNVLQSLLAHVGLVDAVLVRETENGLQLIDGHLRASLDGDTMLPALVLDVTTDEADLILATFDPVAAMAKADATKFAELIDQLGKQAEAVEAMFEELQEISGVFEATDAEFPELPSGERTTLHTMNFTLTADQEATVKEALNMSKGMGEFIDTGNANSNGNAIARICEVFLER